MASLEAGQVSAIKETAKEFGVSNIRMFGSRANGTAKESSDLDLLVQFEPHATLLTVIGFKQMLEQKLGLKVDVVEDRGLSPFLAERITSEAIAI